MVEENHLRAVQGTIVKVDYHPIAGGEQIDAKIILKGNPLPTTWRDDQVHHTTAPELTWNPKDCIYCQQCHLVCERGCLHLRDNALEIDQEKCNTCGLCARECPSMALEIVGETTTAAALLHKILRQNYAIARKISRVTLSGGEPGLQTAFCADLLLHLRGAGKTSVLETSGQVPFADLLPLLHYPAVLKFELITLDENLHRQLTGYSNTRILHNLTQAAAAITPKTQLVVRTPMIRSQTATKGQITATGSWMASALRPRQPIWQLFEPKTICDDSADLSKAEREEIAGWARQAYPLGNLTLFNQS